jgi:hypothetical protein
MNCVFSLKNGASAGEYIVRLSDSVDALKKELPSETGICDPGSKKNLWTFLIHLAHRLALTVLTIPLLQP